eukprot:TRINITY_DN15100_c2_g1_i1.p1 TRINITY_DN15100_c2_g1~~TRINITY_DN15100_c2_g1_i1.p1  ORF type:complete len:212 (+),score=53.98 TRINITY_DN15100_c2_g1_i1:63-698(+)
MQHVPSAPVPPAGILMRMARGLQQHVPAAGLATGSHVVPGERTPPAAGAGLAEAEGESEEREGEEEGEEEEDEEEVVLWQRGDAPPQEVDPTDQERTGPGSPAASDGDDDPADAWVNLLVAGELRRRRKAKEAREERQRISRRPVERQEARKLEQYTELYGAERAEELVRLEASLSARFGSAVAASGRVRTWPSAPLRYEQHQTAEAQLNN